VVIAIGAWGFYLLKAFSIWLLLAMILLAMYAVIYIHYIDAFAISARLGKTTGAVAQNFSNVAGKTKNVFRILRILFLVYIISGVLVGGLMFTIMIYKSFVGPYICFVLALLAYLYWKRAQVLSRRREAMIEKMALNYEIYLMAAASEEDFYLPDHPELLERFKKKIK
jgi:hypothetical protein